MRTMRKLKPLLVLSVILPLLTGCFLMGERPTPIVVAPATTPVEATATEAVEPTATATVPTASPTPEETPVAQAPTPTPTIPPSPSPTASPSPSPVPTWPPTTSGQAIALDHPASGQSVGNPVLVRGRTRQWPFEGTLVIHVYDAEEQLAAEVPIIAEGEFAGPTTFEHEITYGGVPGPGRIEVVEYSPVDGSVVARAGVDVTLTGLPGGGYIELPQPLTEVTLPIKLLARVGTPNQQVRVTVTWDDFTAPGGTARGETFEHVLTTLEGLDGRGLLIVSLDAIDPGFEQPQTARGHIEIQSLDGSTLAIQPVRILHPQDPGTVSVQVFWARNETLAPQTLRIPRTPGIARAALEALLWGPVPGNPEGYITYIPTPEQVLAYPGRYDDWGERVRIRGLNISNGVAYADFSLELGAYAGGALPSIMIREQIEATLTQFTTVNSAVITVNGMSGILEP